MIKKSLLVLVVMFTCAQVFAQKKTPKTDTNINVANEGGKLHREKQWAT
ncbi:MAG: hypothetical protein WDO15_08585 [Bacteroidota bacterium]